MSTAKQKAQKLHRAAGHSLKARRVRFDFSGTPLHWLPEDPFSSYMINGIHLLLPAGELWFCRVYNQALPLVSDDALRAEVEGFIRQEAIHSRAHSGAQEYLRRHGLSVEDYVARVDWLFGTFLGDTPLAVPMFRLRHLEKPWLVLRVGLIAAIEHFTGVLGQWAMDNTSWEEQGEDAVRNFNKGDELETVVLSIDAERERISLGIKQLTDDPFAQYVAANDKGAIVKGVVKAVDAKAATVELAENVEGTLRASEISRDRVNDATEVLNVGDEVEAKIVNVDRKNRVLSLSIKSKDQADEREAMDNLSEQQDANAPKTIGDLIKQQMENSNES